MSIYEIINPHDAYTIEAESPMILAAAILVLGQGNYSAQLIDGDGEDIPIFIFGGALDWFQGKFSRPLQEVLDEHMPEIGAVLGSVVPGDLEKRKVFLAAQEVLTESERLDHRDMWRRGMISSSVDLAGPAWAYADRAKEIEAAKKSA